MFWIYYLFSIPITNEQFGWVVEHAGMWAMGPGFESQVPQNFIQFFLQEFMCNAQDAVHHISHGFRRQIASRLNPRVQIASSSYSLVNACAWDPGKSTRLVWIGLQNCYLHTQIRPKPPGFISFLFHISFLVNCFINYFYYY